MALYFFVLLTLLKFALCLPDPNVKVGIDLRVDDNGCVGVGCNKKTPPKKDCMFGLVVYRNGDYLTSTCTHLLQCTDGTWVFNEKIHKDCGSCDVYGDPYIYSFDLPVYPDGTTVNHYYLNVTGEYIIAQPGFDDYAVFGVKGTFEYCDFDLFHKKDGSCIVDITYHEYDTSIKMTPSSATFTGEIKVEVNGFPFTVGSSVKAIGGLGGAMLVFKHYDTILLFGVPGYNLNCTCISIVGTQGFSVTLCEKSEHYPYLFIRAMPSLKSPPFQPANVSTSALYGLCNTYTVGNAEYFVKKDKSAIATEDCLKDADEYWEVPTICEPLTDSWKGPWPPRT